MSSRKPPQNPAPKTGSDREKQLEMRVAELEDKLSKLQGFAEEYRRASAVISRESLPGSATGLRAVLTAESCIDWRLRFIIPLSGSARDFWSDLGNDDESE